MAMMETKLTPTLTPCGPTLRELGFAQKIDGVWCAPAWMQRLVYRGLDNNQLVEIIEQVKDDEETQEAIVLASACQLGEVIEAIINGEVE